MPNAKQSIFLLLALLDDVIQRENLNLQVQVQAIQGITQAVKTLAEAIAIPDAREQPNDM